jgi:hypothetical protein
MKKILMSLVLVLGFLCTYGQETAKKSLFYPTDGYKLSREQKSELSTFLDSAFKAGKVANIIMIQGHTDSAASNNYNIKLSQRRSGEVQQFIKHKGLSDVKIEVKSYGENKPRFKYFSPDAMAKNRRVDVEIVYHATPIESKIISLKTTIIDLYKLLENAADTFYIYNNFDTILQAKNGTIVSIPANTICDRENKWDRIKVAIKEVSNTSAMLSQNASTGSGRNLLITGGMVQISAFDLQNRPLHICDDKSFTILVPTQLPDVDMQLFYASRDKDFGLDWELQNPEEKLDIINASLFKECLYSSQSGGSGACVHCRLFFCKIRYIISDIFYKALTSRKNKLARNFTSYQQRRLGTALADVCDQRRKKLKEIEEKYNGINTSKLQELTSEDAAYYIFNSTQMDWINCDRYLGLPPAQLTNVTLPLRSASTTDVKLILSSDKAIMPSYEIDGKIGFPNVPKGAKAQLLGLKYENGQPALALKEITIGDNENEMDLEFKDYSLSELKKMLEKL